MNHCPSRKRDPLNSGPVSPTLSLERLCSRSSQSYFQQRAGGGGDQEKPPWIYQWQILPNLIALQDDKLAGWMTTEQARYTFDTIPDSILNRQIGKSRTTEADDKVMENGLEHQGPAGLQWQPSGLILGSIQFHVFINRLDQQQ